MRTLTLSKPVSAHGETVSELTFAEATGGAILNAGIPWMNDWEGNSLICPKAIGRLIAQLANVPPSSVEKLAGPDFIAAMGIVNSLLKDAPATAEAPPAADDGTVFLPLRRPIELDGKALSFLTFREPSGGDVLNSGMPLIKDPEGNSRISAKAVGALVSRMAGIPMETVRSMYAPDFSDAMGVVVGFFGGATRG